MRNLLNISEVTSREVNEVKEQVQDQLKEFYVVCESEKEIADFFSNFEDFDGSWSTNKVESHIIEKETAMDPDIIIDVYENYIDSGSVDYVYTVNVEERF